MIIASTVPGVCSMVTISGDKDSWVMMDNFNFRLTLLNAIKTAGISPRDVKAVLLVTNSKRFSATRINMWLSGFRKAASYKGNHKAKAVIMIKRFPKGL